MYVFYGALLLSIPVAIAYLISVARLFGRLKRGHREVYLELGEPSFLNNSIGNSLRTFKFLVSGKYKSLQDSQVNSLAALARGLFILGLALYCVCAVVLTFYWSALRQ
jgi:hypothetical protein